MSDDLVTTDAGPGTETLEQRAARLDALEAEIAKATTELEAIEKQSDLLAHMRPKYRRFVEEYTTDLNGTEAAIRAGWNTSRKTAGWVGSKLLERPDIRAAIDAAIASRSARVGITSDTVINEMALLAMSSVEHYQVTDDGQVAPAPGAPHGVMRAIRSIKRRTTVRTDANGEIHKIHDVELQLWDKPTPLRLLGKHVGLFPDRVELTGKDGGPIISKVVREIVDPLNTDIIEGVVLEDTALEGKPS